MTSAFCPGQTDHIRKLKMLENDVTQAQGEAVILETVALDPGQEAKVLTRFKADRNEAYVEFVDKCGDFEREAAKEVTASHYTYAELEENDVDLKKLQGWLAKIEKLDFYAAERAGASEGLRGRAGRLRPSGL